MSKIVIKNIDGVPHINGRMCTYETTEIGSEISSFFEVNDEFVLPHKYKIVRTPLGRAKICLVDDPIKDKALTMLQLLSNATGAQFEDEELALNIIIETLKNV